MKAILALVLLLLPLAIGYAIGMWQGRKIGGGAINRADRKELEHYRTQQYALHSAAAEGMALSDGTAFKVNDILINTRKELSK